MERAQKITVVIVDDHQLIRQGFASLIKEDDSLQLIAEAASGEEGLKKICNLKPRIAIVDIELPDITGLELTRRIKKTCEETEVIIITGHKNEEYFNEAMEIGVSGYFLKDDTKDLPMAIKSICNGDSYLSPGVHCYVSGIYKKRSRFIKENPNLEKLTNRELEILSLISENMSNLDIGKNLNIDKRTVETHRNNIREKLELKHENRNALLVFALKNKELIHKYMKLKGLTQSLRITTE